MDSNQSFLEKIYDFVEDEKVGLFKLIKWCQTKKLLPVLNYLLFVIERNNDYQQKNRSTLKGKFNTSFISNYS